MLVCCLSQSELFWLNILLKYNVGCGVNITFNLDQQLLMKYFISCHMLNYNICILSVIFCENTFVTNRFVQYISSITTLKFNRTIAQNYIFLVIRIHSLSIYWTCHKAHRAFFWIWSPPTVIDYLIEWFLISLKINPNFYQINNKRIILELSLKYRTCNIWSP